MLNDGLRPCVAALAGELLPGNDRQPCAGDVDLAGAPLDQVLSSRPDLEAGLIAILERFRLSDTQAPQVFIQSLKASELRLLLTVMCGAYFLVDQVRRSVGYPGQEALTLDRGGFGAEELALKQMALPKRYRHPPDC